MTSQACQTSGGKKYNVEGEIRQHSLTKEQQYDEDRRAHRAGDQLGRGGRADQEAQRHRSEGGQQDRAYRMKQGAQN